MDPARKVPRGRFSPVRWVAETGSTNHDLLAEAIAGRSPGGVLVADHQNAGRGRQGRRWVDDPGHSLLFSVLLFVEPDIAGFLPLAAGMAVRAGIAEFTPTPVGLKWPNDVLIADRKVAGILAESATTARGFAVVVGCGINVAFEAGPPVEVADRATDLASTGSLIDRALLLESILGHLEPLVDRLESGDVASVLDDYRRCCVSLGRRVRLDTPNGDVSGLVVGIADNGGITIETDDRSRRTVLAGDAHHLS